jgi:hypothetical protein
MEVEWTDGWKRTKERENETMRQGNGRIWVRYLSYREGGRRRKRESNKYMTNKRDERAMGEKQWAVWSAQFKSGPAYWLS